MSESKAWQPPGPDWGLWDQFFSNQNAATSAFSQGFAIDDVKQMEESIEALDRAKAAVRQRVDNILREALDDSK